MRRFVLCAFLFYLCPWFACTATPTHRGEHVKSTSVTTVREPLPAGGRSRELVGETVADRPSPYYQFVRHYLDSADGKRRYRIDIAVPDAPAPAAGYPVLYMLDGNAAIASLTDDDLAILTRQRPLVLVAIGYDVPTRNDVVARAYDYTPPVQDENGHIIAAPVVRDRVGGGANLFLQFINTRIKPLVQSHVPIDTQRESLWGHSYGGIFVLHALWTQPQAFARYIAGDPSLWWHDGALLKQWQAFDKARAAGKYIALLVGTKPRDPGRPPPPSQQTQGGGAVDTRGVTQAMAATLQQHGAHAHWQAFPQYGHGEMLRASLEYALMAASAPHPR